MKNVFRNNLHRLVTLKGVTKFVAKLFRMRSKFRNGEYVQLKFDRGQKFIVISDTLIDGKIQVGYFDSHGGIITTADIDPSHLEYSVEEMYRRLNELNGNK